MELQVDPNRKNDYAETTSIYIRANDAEDGWGSYDIAQLDLPSLISWLEDVPQRSSQVVCLLLGHDLEAQGETS